MFWNKKVSLSRDDILYIDADYISSQYESIKGVSPHIKITKTESLNGGIKALFLTANASSIESKAYEISVIEMLLKIFKKLNEKPKFILSEHDTGKKSSYVWVSGYMTVKITTVKRTERTIRFGGKPKDSTPGNQEKIVAEEHYFSIVQNSPDEEFALITTPEYFTSGIGSIIDLSTSVASEINFPVKALIRVLPVKSSFSEWLSVPLLIIEK